MTTLKSVASRLALVPLAFLLAGTADAGSLSPVSLLVGDLTAGESSLPDSAASSFDLNSGVLPDSGIFRTPPELKERVEFWKKIYTTYTTRQVVLHDRDRLDVIFGVVDYPGELGPRATSSHSRRRLLSQRKGQIEEMLRSLSRGNAPRTADERRIVELYGGDRREMSEAAGRIRSQLGQADRFREGLIRSGRYLSHMRRIFRGHGLPEELCALPHVESSFNYEAYSSVGAAGIWQFMRGTGRLFMRVDYTVDERRDPIVATAAAARLLKHNKEELGAWPLAITAYNHGTNSMKRAKAMYGADMARIIDHYRSRSFGFASKNFYAEFLAALEVARSYRSHFGDLVLEPPLSYEEVRLDSYVSASALEQSLPLDRGTLRQYNPALRESVWRGYRLIPEGYRVRVPGGKGEALRTALATIPSTQRSASQTFEGVHVVARGETLSGIASQYRVSLTELQGINGIRGHMIRIGQRLEIPDRGSRGRARAARTLVVQEAKPGQYHTVQPGDSLYDIARTYGVGVADLKQLNDLAGRNPRIFPGQKLLLSAGSELPKVASVAPAAVEPLPARAPAPVTAKVDPAAANEGDAAPDQEPRLTDEGEQVTVGPRKIALRKELYKVRRINDAVGEITVEAEETLGHYAEWCDTTGTGVQRLNHRNLRTGLRIGGTVRIPLNKVDAAAFEQRRFEYHSQLLEDYFAAYRIEGEQPVTIRRGQSLWDLCVREHDAPLWLVRIFNPGLNLDEIRPGDSISMPLVSKRP